MSDALQIEFQKWEGTGNTFMIVNGLKLSGSRDLTKLDDAFVKDVCCQQNCDGFIVICESSVDEADLKCDYRNSDGSRSFCGNGTRASFVYARSEGLVGDSAVFEACDGLHSVRHHTEKDVPSVKFRPIVGPELVNSKDFFLDSGSPHYVHLVKDFDELCEIDIDAFGRKIRYSDAYSDQGGVNVNALCTVEDGLALRTYERGVEAETQACGTGAVAASIVDYSLNGGVPKRTVHMPGGKLFVEFIEDGKGGYKNVWLSGAASQLSRGIIGALSLFLLWFCSPISIQANWYESLGKDTEVSILTSSPGDDAYSIFGHAAVRIYDPAQVPIVDWVFNYGTFSFSEDFYYNFMIGRLDYHISALPFYQFQTQYLKEGRGVKEQKLNLTPLQVKQVAEYLAWNLQEENAVYSYDFFRDNCATRLIYLLQESLGKSFEANCVGSGRTFRDGLQPYMSGVPWTAFGINFLLGPKSDQMMPPCGDAFIPDDLSMALSQMTVDGIPMLLIKGESFVVFDEGSWLPESVLEIPSVVMILLAFMLLFLILMKKERWWFTKTLRAVVAVSSSLLGLLLLCMWFFTNHTDTWANMNLIWTLPALVYFIPISSGLKKTSGKIASIVCLSYLVFSVFELQFASLALRCACIAVFLTILPFRKEFNLIKND